MNHAGLIRRTNNPLRARDYLIFAPTCVADLGENKWIAPTFVAIIPADVIRRAASRRPSPQEFCRAPDFWEINAATLQMRADDKRHRHHFGRIIQTSPAQRASARRIRISMTR